MLTEIYIEALLVDEELADHVWGAWSRERRFVGASVMRPAISNNAHDSIRAEAISPNSPRSCTDVGIASTLSKA